MKKLLCVLTLVGLAGCSTIRFEHEIEIGDGNKDIRATPVYVHMALVQPF